MANEAKKLARERGMRDKWKAFWKKSWASYKFAMTDPQPFRDKLVIPTQSLQIFLHSMTHVGLANVGNLLALSGHLPDAAVADPVATKSAVGSWEVVGTKLAFRKARSLGSGTLTADLEEEVIRYVLHLQKGGQPFDAKEVPTTRPRSKSRGSVSYSRDKRGDTYIVRKKTTAYVSSPSKTTPSTKDASWSKADRLPLRLDIPAPSSGARSPISPSSPRIVDARPDFEVSSDDEILPARRASFSGANQARREQEPKSAQEPPTSINSRYTLHGFTDVKFTRRDCRRKVEDEIKLEQEEAAREMRDVSIRMRSQRRTRLSRPESQMNEKEESESDSEDIIDMLAEQYGLRIERLAVDRPPINNGTVVPVLPASLVEPDEPVEAPLPTILPKRGARLTSETSFYDSSFRTKRSRYSRPSVMYDTVGREAFVSRPYRHEERYRDDLSVSSEEPIAESHLRASAPNVIIYDHDEGRRTRPQVHQQHKRSSSYGGSDHREERPTFIVRRHSQGHREDMSPRVDSGSDSG